jgi:putative ABC transport system permease protein
VIVFRLALRELRSDPRFALFFVLNLALGLAGFVAQDAFQDSVARELRARSQAFMAGDVMVEARRPFTEAEVERLDGLAGADARRAQAVELFSMAAAGERARLVELQAIDAVFPLYGDIVLEGSGPAGDGARAALRERGGVWADPALLHGLGVEVGDEIAIGALRAPVLGTIARDGGRPASGFSLAPRVYLALERLPATGLVQTGSRIEYRRFYRLAAGDPLEVAKSMRLAQGDDGQLEVRSHEEATRELSRVYDQVSRALGLVSLAAVFLAAVGAAHLFRAFLLRRVREVAILLAVGATRRLAERVYLALLALLGAASGVLACALGALLLPLVARAAQGFVPADVSPRIGAAVFAQVVALAAAGGVAACLPLLAGLRALRPAQLFAEGSRPELPRARTPWSALPPALLFAAVCFWRAPTWTTGAWFAGLFGAALALLTGCGVALLRGLARLPAPRSLALRHALRELARGRAAALACFVALALCVLLQGLAPQLRASLTRDLEAPEAGSLPSLFLFDIQPEQREAVTRHVTERGAQLGKVSPLVRARLLTLRGEPVAEASEGEAPPARARAARDAEADARRLRRRSYNLTYPFGGTASEELVAGRDFSGPRSAGASEPAEISLEREFAERLGVGVGDALGFDIQGVAVEGRVVNLREVRWQTFEPNFFVAFQPGVLEDAPQTFLASVPALPDAEREALQASLAEAFPNVSSVDVTRTVARLLGLADRLEWALAGTAALSLLVGLASVHAIARDQARARRYEINLQKILGADFRRIRAALDWEYALLGLCAAVAGSLLCALASAVLARLVLEVPWRPSIAPLAASAAGVPLLCVAAARLAARRVLRERPLVLLQER